MRSVKIIFYAIKNQAQIALEKLFNSSPVRTEIVDDEDWIEVEFVGGPCDGHIEWTIDTDELLERSVIAVEIRPVLQPAGCSRIARLDLERRAIYGLHLSQRGWQYRFARITRVLSST